MKVALVHELLTMKGGAENVLRIFAEMFPHAPIYTLLYDEETLGQWFAKDRVLTSALQRHARWSTNHHLYLRSFPSAVEAWDFSAFDLVLSSSSAFAHGIITNGKPRHLCYVHSPARYLWDRTHDVLDRASQGPFGWLKRIHLSRTFHQLRMCDSEAAERPDMLISASKEVRRRIELYWRRESDVIYPPIDDTWFEKIHNPKTQIPKSFYVIVSTLVPYKRIDIAIEACNQLKVPLKIAGEGPDRRRLEKMAGPTIEFLGFQKQEDLKKLYVSAKATIFPGDEDFGLVPLESLACGTPVIAYKKGGALETIEEGVSGEFFEEPTAGSLVKTIKMFEEKKYDSQKWMDPMDQWSRKKFEEKIRKAVDVCLQKI